jgi:hypothetical protein
MAELMVYGILGLILISTGTEMKFRFCGQYKCKTGIILTEKANCDNHKFIIASQGIMSSN